MLITAALMVCTKKYPDISEEEVKNSVYPNKTYINNTGIF